MSALTMSPTPEASERQRKAAFKAWETVRRKQAEKAKVKLATSEIGEAVESKGINLRRNGPPKTSG
jgi:hypothetical protein